MDRYSCLLCPTGPKERMVWTCAGTSEIVDLHPGFLDYRTASDFVIMHLDRITSTMEFVKQYTLPSGREITNFIRTGNGLLADRLIQRPGCHVYVIPGLSQHSDLYRRENIGGLKEWNYLNTRYSGLRAMVFSTVLILNPGQDNSLQSGKMSFDLEPKIMSSWFTPFVNSWSYFVERNPSVVINGLYVVDHGLCYGSPSDMEVSHRLHGYAGLPLLLQYFRSVFTRLLSKIMGIGKQKPTDPEAWVPLGKLTIIHLFNWDNSFLDSLAVGRYVSGKFGKTGRLVMLGDDPESSFNLVMGQLVLNLWQMVDMLNILRIPKDPMRPVRNPYHKRPNSAKWCLTDFVPEQVRSSGTHFSAFPYCCAASLLISLFRQLCLW